MADNKKSKRILLVNRDFQLRYTKAAIGVATISTILSGSVILYPLYVFEILRIPKFLPPPILAAMGLAVLINVGLIAFFGIVLTHRLAGPIYALSREFRKIGGGFLGSTLKIRDGDDLRYLVRTFNEMSLSLKHSFENDTLALERLRQKLVQDPKLMEAFPAEMNEALKELEALQQNFKKRIVNQQHSSF